MSPRGRGRWLIGQLVDGLRLAKARPGPWVTLHRRIGDPAAAAMAQWPSTVGVSEPLTGSAGLSIVGALVPTAGAPR
jgi:hypothetical protein